MSLTKSNFYTNFVSTVNFLGSIASVTGISLLWLQKALNIDFEESYDLGVYILSIAIASSLTLGILGIAVMIIQAVHANFLNGKSNLAKATAYLIITPILLLGVILLLIYVVYDPLTWIIKKIYF